MTLALLMLIVALGFTLAALAMVVILDRRAKRPAPPLNLNHIYRLGGHDAEAR